MGAEVNGFDFLLILIGLTVVGLNYLHERNT